MRYSCRLRFVSVQLLTAAFSIQMARRHRWNYSLEKGFEWILSGLLFNAQVVHIWALLLLFLCSNLPLLRFVGCTIVPIPGALSGYISHRSTSKCRYFFFDFLHTKPIANLITTNARQYSQLNSNGLPLKRLS